MIKSKKQMFIVIGAFILVMILGTVTYAFFNYTRTGSANTVKTGRIYFNAEQDAAVTLSDLFPITTNGNVTSSTPGVGSLSIHVTGNTSYSEGVEYLVKAVNVTGSNGTNLPISISIGYEANNEKTIGTEDEDYFTNRGGATSRYKILSSDTIEEGTDLVVGYIAPDANGTGIDGNIIIMAYLDAQNIAITDTNPEQTVRTVNNNLTNDQLTTCASILSSYNATTTWCGGTGTITYETENYTFQELLDANILTSGQITSLLEAGIITEYTDGTTDAWVNGRTVFTTEEWNALQASGVSFQVKVEANEGTWVENPKLAWKVISQVEGLRDVAGAKRYVGGNTTTNNYVYFNGNEKWRIIGVYGNQLKIIKAENSINMAYTEYSATATNEWNGSTIETYLNGDYYNGLTSTAKDMISVGTWNIGKTTGETTAIAAYTSAQTDTWTGKVGLIAAYEYLYGTSSNNCDNIFGNYGSYSTICGQTMNNWIWPGSGSYWTISASSAENNKAIKYTNSLYGDNYIYGADNAFPVVYLKSSVVINGGDGSIDTPYELQ